MAYSVYNSQGMEDMWVTSINDSAHSSASLHYSGCAFDLRTHGVTDPPLVRSLIKDALGVDFDVLLENQGTPNQHIHVEYQPKRP